MSMKRDVKQLRSFLGAKTGRGTIFCAALMTFGIFLMAASLIFVFHGLWKVVLVIAVIGLCVAAVGFGLYTVAQNLRRRNTRWIAELEGTDALQRLVQDFQGAQPQLYGSVRLGAEQLYAEHYPRPIPYSDIVRAYRQLDRAPLAGAERAVWAVLNDAQQTKVRLGDAPLTGEEFDEAAELLEQLQKKNPGIRIGKD